MPKPAQQGRFFYVRDHLPMDKVDRWLLPEGIEEMLPAEASNVESLRRRLVDLFRSWGYDYIIPPMVEFVDSLLSGSGEDAELLTFKLTDQLSGKTMGIRADITPQVARMDAHSLQREGTNRLCYAGHVMYTRPKSPLSSRTPVQVGVELFGEAGLGADIEVISLLIESLETAGLQKQYIDIGHAAIFKALAAYAELSKEDEAALFDLLQVKATNDVDVWVKEKVSKADAARWLLALPRLSGSASVLIEAERLFAGAPAAVIKALEELQHLAEVLQQRYPQANLYFDLSELRGYHYYTGIIFGAFAPGVGNAIANGGRYDHIGEAFGRARPASGFAADLSAISRINLNGQALGVQTETPGIFARSSENEFLWDVIKELRSKGERVVCGLGTQERAYDYQNCDRVLVEENGQYIVKTLTVEP